jgi:hypothetical protein
MPKYARHLPGSRIVFRLADGTLICNASALGQGGIWTVTYAGINLDTACRDAPSGPDLLGSGMIDGSYELTSTSCSLWRDLNPTFPGSVTTYTSTNGTCAGVVGVFNQISIDLTFNFFTDMFTLDSHVDYGGAHANVFLHTAPICDLRTSLTLANQLAVGPSNIATGGTATLSFCP